MAPLCWFVNWIHRGSSSSSGDQASLARDGFSETIYSPSEFFFDKVVSATESSLWLAFKFLFPLLVTPPRFVHIVSSILNRLVRCIYLNFQQRRWNRRNSCSRLWVVPYALRGSAAKCFYVAELLAADWRTKRCVWNCLILSYNTFNNIRQCIARIGNWERGIC